MIDKTSGYKVKTQDKRICNTKLFFFNIYADNIIIIVKETYLHSTLDAQ